MKNKKTKDLILYAMFIAIEMLLVFIPFLGYIPIGPLRATTLHIPVIIAGIILGKKGGSIIGLVFGLSSGFVTGFIFEQVIKHKWNKYAGMIVASLAGALTNTILVLGGIYLIFGQSYAQAIGQDFNLLMAYLIGIVTSSGLLEAVVGTVIAVLVCQPLLMFTKKGN